MFRKLVLTAALSLSALGVVAPATASAHDYGYHDRYDRVRYDAPRRYYSDHPRYHRWEDRRWHDHRRRYWARERWERRHHEDRDYRW